MSLRLDNPISLNQQPPCGRIMSFPWERFVFVKWFVNMNLLAILLVIIALLVSGVCSSQEIIWERLYGDWNDLPDSTRISVGANGIINVGDTCFIISAGITQGVIDDWHSIERSWILKTDMEGDIIWEHWIDEEIMVQYETLMRTENGDLLYLTMANIDNGRSTRLKLIKISDDGEELWQRTYDYGYSDEPINAIVTNEGNIMIIGERKYRPPTRSLEFIFVLDDNCDSVSYHEYWIPDEDNFFSRPCRFMDIIQLEENRILITGYLLNRNSAINYTILFEVDALGDSVRFQSYNWNGNYTGKKLAQDENGNIIVGGHEGTLVGERVYTDAFLAKFSPDLDHIWHRSYGGFYADALIDLKVLPDERIVFTGYLINEEDLSAFGWLQILDQDGEEFASILDCGIGRGCFCDFTLINGGNEIAIAANTYVEWSPFRYLWRVNIGHPGAVGDQAPMPSSFVVFPAYPNPFNNSTRIEFELSIPAVVTFVLYDVNGKLILNFPDIKYVVGQHTFNLDISSVSDLANGQYFISLQTANRKTIIPVTYVK